MSENEIHEGEIVTETETPKETGTNLPKIPGMTWSSNPEDFTAMLLRQPRRY